MEGDLYGNGGERGGNFMSEIIIIIHCNCKF